MKQYKDVDVIAELEKLVEQHVEHYKNDFDIDKGILRRAAESDDPAEKTLLWMCRRNGTHCLRESEAFIRDTREHNTFRFYDEQTREEIIARVVIPKKLAHGRIIGDVVEINYREEVARVAKEAVSPQHVKLTFEDGFIAEAPTRGYVQHAMTLVPEHGKVDLIRTVPQDAEAHALLLTQRRNERSKLPVANQSKQLPPQPKPKKNAEKPSVRDRLKAEAAKPSMPQAKTKPKGKDMEL